MKELFSIIATRKMKDVPGPLQNIAEMAVGGLLNFFAGVLGEKKARHYFPMLGSFFVLIIVCNYSGLIPGSGDLFTVPTSVLTVTAALSTISFVAIQSSGIKKRGLGKYLGTFFKPFAFLFPILILEQFTRPLSMALRLYGNIYGEELAAETLFELFPVGLPIVMQNKQVNTYTIIGGNTNVNSTGSYRNRRCTGHRPEHDRRRYRPGSCSLEGT